MYLHPSIVVFILIPPAVEITKYATSAGCPYGFAATPHMVLIADFGKPTPDIDAMSFSVLALQFACRYPDKVIVLPVCLTFALLISVLFSETIFPTIKFPGIVLVAIIVWHCSVPPPFLSKRIKKRFNSLFRLFCLWLGFSLWKFPHLTTPCHAVK